MLSIRNVIYCLYPIFLVIFQILEHAVILARKTQSKFALTE